MKEPMSAYLRPANARRVLLPVERQRLQSCYPGSYIPTDHNGQIGIDLCFPFKTKTGISFVPFPP